MLLHSLNKLYAVCDGHGSFVISDMKAERMRTDGFFTDESVGYHARAYGDTDFAFILFDSGQQSLCEKPSFFYPDHRKYDHASFG